MSFLNAGNTSDVEQDKGLSDYRLSRSNNNLGPKPNTSKFADVLWNSKNDGDSDSEISDSGNFLAKGKFNTNEKKMFFTRKNASNFGLSVKSVVQKKM